MPSRSAPAARRPSLAFWIHQVVEYLLGLLVVTQSILAAQPAVVTLIGVGILLLAATADGPLAAFHVVPRPLHRVLDVVAAVAIVLLVVLQHDDLDPIGLAFALGSAGVLVFLAVRTDSHAPKRGRTTQAAADGGSSASGDASVAPAESVPSAGATSGSPPTVSKGERYGRAAGRALGKGIRSYRDRPTPPADPGGS